MPRANGRDEKSRPKWAAFRCLLGVFHDLGLTQNVNLDLTGILQLILDALCQVAGQNDHLILAAVGVGAGFASFENICSMIVSGTESLGFLLIRGLAVGVMHIVSVLAMTMGLVIARRFQALRLSSTLGALSLSMLFHGVYNLLVSKSGVTSWIGYVLPLLTALMLFLALRRLRSEE